MNTNSLDSHIPLVAILRGLTTERALSVANILIDEGFTIIEVPLNSPNALETIRLLVDSLPNNLLIGAGTVTTAEQAESVMKTGANLVVTPNYNSDVVKICKKHHCVSFIGVSTPTEAFNAHYDGATGLKLFPISTLGLEGFSALKSVLPENALCFPVGGIMPTTESLAPYLDAGAAGFGLGSSLFNPLLSDDEIRQNAQQFIATYNHIVND